MKNIGCLSNGVVGDYKLVYGEGLVMNNGFSLGKSAFVRSSQGIRPHAATDEYNFLRGTAVTLSKNGFDVTAWVSMRRLDATLTDEGYVRTMQTSGMHRTQTELNRKHNVRALTTGGHIGWTHGLLRLGATGYFYHLNREMEPGNEVYRKYYPRGNTFGVAGLHYGYGNRWFSFSGETAYSTEQQGVATLNKLIWKINPRYTLMGLQRYYSKRYYSFFASALSENSTVQNESGAMVRLDAEPLSGWTLMAYADFFHNPWPRYQLTHSSSGQDFVIQNDVRLKGNHQLAVRYQLKRKERSNQMENHNRLRITYSVLVKKMLRLKTQVNLHNVSQCTGVAFSQSVNYRHTKRPADLSGMITYFHTPAYQQRVYVYESSVRNAFSFSSLYGHGVRFSTILRYAFWQQRLGVELKYSGLCFFDRTTQGTGMQQIRSRWKNDLCVQFRLKV